MKSLDPVLIDKAAEGGNVHSHRVTNEKQACTRRESGEYLFKTDIEIQGGELHGPRAYRRPNQVPPDEIHQRAVRHTNGLRRSRRTRSVNYINPILGRNERFRIIVTIARDLIPLLIEADHTRAGFWNVRCETSLRQHDRTTGVSQHEGQTYGRIRGIKRQAGCSGLECTNDTDDHFQRTFHEDADHVACNYAEAAQMMGQLIGPRVQLPVAQPFIFQSDGHGLGRPLNLGFKKLVRAKALIVFSAGVVPLNQQLAFFSLDEEWQLRNARRRIADDAFKQSL